MNRFEWTSAPGVAQAAAAGNVTVAAAMRTQSGVPGTGATVLKAGGIDLLDLMKEGLLTPKRIVNLRAIAELGRIAEEPDGSVRIGAMVTLAQLAADPLVRGRYRALAEAAGNSASPALYPQIFLTRIGREEGETLAQRLQERIAPPHELVSWGRIVVAAEIATQACYETDTVAKVGGLLDVFF